MSVICGISIRKAKALCTKFREGSAIASARHVSMTKDSSSIKNIPQDEIRKSVFISQSTDIHTNLALEDWFYRNFDFSKHHILLLYKNDPCVVIGRHQNPWLECNGPTLESNDIALARRNSGGGTVYHDLGNINLSFFAPRERYNRRYNLEIITRALFREWGLKTLINKKEDIVVQNEFKVSGTASKLGKNTYHHCTLLVDANKGALSQALKKIEHGMTTNATESIRSPVKNLREVNPHVRSDILINAVGWEYLRTKALTLEDGGQQLVQKQKGFQMINPTEDWFPGIEQLKQNFKNWEWVYGMSPKFTVTRMLVAPRGGDPNQMMKLVIEVEKGIIQDVKMTLPSDLNKDASVITNFRGERYSHDITNSIVAATGCKDISQEVSADKSDIAAI